MRRGYDVFESGLIGRVTVVVSEEGLEHVFLLEEHMRAYQMQHPELQRDKVLCKEAVEQLKAYFEGKRLFFDLVLKEQGTVFRKKVWQALSNIPYGSTMSYKEIAQGIGQPKAVRAVGGANAANPVPIVIPCHRVIGADGRMTGFLGSHTSVKEKLLAHEKKVLETIYKN